jgi:hypothetical protein
MTAEIIPFKVPGKPKRTCSFCKQAESSAKKMFSNEMEGENLRCICDKCIVECSKRINNDETNN